MNQSWYPGIAINHQSSVRYRVVHIDIDTIRPSSNRHVAVCCGLWRRPVTAACDGGLCWLPVMAVCDGCLWWLPVTVACGGCLWRRPVMVACDGGLWWWPVTAACDGGLWWWPVTAACDSGLWRWPVTVACDGGLRRRPVTAACDGVYVVLSGRWRWRGTAPTCTASGCPRRTATRGTAAAQTTTGWRARWQTDACSTCVPTTATARSYCCASKTRASTTSRSDDGAHTMDSSPRERVSLCLAGGSIIRSWTLLANVVDGSCRVKLSSIARRY